MSNNFLHCAFSLFLNHMFRIYTFKFDKIKEMSLKKLFREFDIKFTNTIQIDSSIWSVSQYEH